MLGSGEVIGIQNVERRQCAIEHETVVILLVYPLREKEVSSARFTNLTREGEVGEGCVGARKI